MRKSRNAVLLNNQPGEFFKTAAGVRQGNLFSPIMFNLSLWKVMQETFHDYHTSISIGGRHDWPTTVDLVSGSSGTNRLVDRARPYEMEVSTEKSKIMTKARTTSVQIVA